MKCPLEISDINKNEEERNKNMNIIQIIHKDMEDFVHTWYKK